MDSGEGSSRATTAQQCSKGLILLKKQTTHLSKMLILHAHEIGTFCIDCTGTPTRVEMAKGAGSGGWKSTATANMPPLLWEIARANFPKAILFPCKTVF
jgi:hypothetical protein